MQELTALLHNHSLLIIIGSFFMVSSVADALPEPATNSSGAYKFTFRFVHSLAGNFKRAAKKFNLPGAE
jgi:hypothetical protein